MIRPFGVNDVILIAEAIRWTLALSAIAFAGGAIGGLLIALARTSDAGGCGRSPRSSSGCSRARRC